MTGAYGAGRGCNLAERFTALLERLDAGSRSEEVYQLLEIRYSEQGRHYHTLDHIRHCLGVLDEVRELLNDADAVELALWFHDAVYTSGARDNELRSAFLFDRYLGIELPTPRADHVHAMIMATVHPSEAVEHDAQYVADIDLSGLSLPRMEFLRDTSSLRKECRYLTDSEFQLGTLSFFRKLMSRPSIFLTEYFRVNYGKRARRNIIELTTYMEDKTGEITIYPDDVAQR